MSNYINDDVKIDFPVSEDIRILMEKCERFDAEDNYGAYNSYANALVYVVCKEACFCGDLSPDQWRQIEERYVL